MIDRLDALRRRLRARADGLSPDLLNLTRAVLNDAGTESAHADCRAALPAYVDAEIAGERVAEKFSRVNQHLAICAACAEQYAELLDVALADQADQISAPATIPAPNLSFLDLRFDAWVKQKAGEILQSIAPAQMRDLADIADVFFEQVNAFEGKFVLQPRAVRALGFESDGLSEALTTLAATWAATKALIGALTPEQVESLAAQNRLGARIEEIAYRAAVSAQVEPTQARPIAHEYAERVSAAPAELRVLIQQQKK